MSGRRWGQGGAPALLLHCTLAQGGAWAGMARHLADRLDMVAPDLLGHGRGPDADRGRDFHDQATEAAAAHLPAEPCHVVGHSFGATIALRLAIEAPERVRSLTLIEPVLFCAADGPGRAAHDAYVLQLPGGYDNPDRHKVARHFVALWGAEDFDLLSPSAQTYMADRIWIPAATEAALIHDRADLLPRLGKMERPTLLLEGSTSHPVIAEINTRLAAELSKARRAVLKGAGHMAPITHARQTADAIAAFLAAL